jgi:UDP-N-acetylglucosamine--N-acetylmuramyl-(pentapeptide) pyrophosphoryl-undecaprenol N-acetylglucosamine transferase
LGKKVFISGGGTGGHYYPALAVSEKLKEEGFSIVYIGTKNGIEGKKGFPFGEKFLFEMGSLRGKSLFKTLKNFISLSKSTISTIKLMKKEKPNFAICFGGYTSVPVGISSFLLGVPLYIHEQNSIPSFTNIILGKFAKKIFITFINSKKYFKANKVIESGLPIRKKLKENLDLTKEEARKKLNIKEDKFVILIFGGSQGAKRLGELAVSLSKDLKEMEFVLITGKNFKISGKIPENLKTIEYTEDMHNFYKAADLVISRAGAGTVYELMAFNKYSIYIPFPYAASNHQYWNVKWLKDLGLSDVIEEKDLNYHIIKNKILELYENKEKLKKIDLRNLVKLNSEEIILDTIKTEENSVKGFRKN